MLFETCFKPDHLQTSMYRSYVATSASHAFSLFDLPFQLGYTGSKQRSAEKVDDVCERLRALGNQSSVLKLGDGFLSLMSKDYNTAKSFLSKGICLFFIYLYTHVVHLTCNGADSIITSGNL